METRNKFNQQEIPPKNEFINLNFFPKSPNPLVSQISENALIHYRIPNRTPPLHLVWNNLFDARALGTRGTAYTGP